ncbi:MAG: hypothetical protein ACI9NC_006163, partial [Verrucomicrobiales bacterium]
RIGGARVQNNHITFGQDQAPRLTFLSGRPVEVWGRINEAAIDLSFGKGFDTAGVVRSRCAGAVWEKSIGEFARLFFARVERGRLELDGRQMKLTGEVVHRFHRWELVDAASGIDPNLDVIDELVVADLKPFKINGWKSGDSLRMEGVVGDVALRDRVAKMVPGADVASLRADLGVVKPPWLAKLPVALVVALDRSLDSSFELAPEAIKITAVFPSEFWKSAAESALRKALPEGVVAEIDCSVALKAVPEEDESANGDPEHEVKKLLHSLPLKMLISRQTLRLEGRVRLKDERDALYEKLGEARPDLQLDQSLNYDWREPELTSLRKRIPDFLVFLASGMTRHGSITLDSDRWEVIGVCADQEFKRWVERLARSFETFVGIPCHVDLRVQADQLAEQASTLLTDYPVYFKPRSAQISHLQAPKIKALAEVLAAVGDGAKILVVGHDGGDGSLAKQRARAVRRQLVGAGLPIGRMELGTGRLEGAADWRSERVEVEIQPAPTGDQA